MRHAITIIFAAFGKVLETGRLAQHVNELDCAYQQLDDNQGQRFLLVEFRFKRINPLSSLHSFR